MTATFEINNNYAIRLLTLKQKGFILLENSLVALVATSYVLTVFNCFCSTVKPVYNDHLGDEVSAVVTDRWSF